MQWCEVKYGICGELFINHFNAGNLSTHDWDEIGPLHRGTGICIVRIKKIISSFKSPDFHPMNGFLGKQWHPECSLRESLAACAEFFSTV